MNVYVNEFEDEIDFAVDEFIKEKKYRDFVSFLKFFIDIQDSVLEKVNLILLDDGKYYLLDENGVPVKKELLDSTYCEISAFDDESYIMLNDLVSLAPAYLTIHCNSNDEKEENVKIIRDIFSDRVELCHKCAICSNIKNQTR